MGFVRRHPLLTVLALAAVATTALLGVTAYAVWVAAHTDEASRVDRADVIIVLGAAQYGGRPSPVFERRLSHAVLLYERGFATTILVVGGNRKGDASTEATAGQAWLIENGVPGEATLAEPQGSTTLESLRGAAHVMRHRGMDSAFLVSDPWHNLRVRRMARDLGIEAYVSATWRSAARTQWRRLEGYSRETFGYLYYRLFGR